MYGREELENLSVYCLRSLAREIGVYGPTLYRKKGLIDAIMEVQNGEREPSLPATRGRPPKPIVVPTKTEEEQSLPTESTDAENKEGKMNREEDDEYFKVENMLKRSVKKELIARILQEVEAKLNEIL